MCTTRIFAVKPKVQILNCTQLGFLRKKSELQILKCTQLGLLRQKPELQILKCTTQIFAVKIRTANFETKQLRFSN